MSYSYILIMDNASNRNCQALSIEQESTLSNMGMSKHDISDSIRMFIAEETPVLQLSKRGLLIGNLFTNDYQPVEKESKFPEFENYDELGTYLLENYWGEYILFYHETDSEGFSVLRDPSGGIPCVYSGDNSPLFFTSDISIAIDLKLYKKAIDWDFIANCLIYPHIKTERSGLSGIKELLPGSSVTFNNTILNVRQDWSPFKFVSDKYRHKDTYTASVKLRETIEGVVKAWAIIDKSILLELSGGLDSSIVAACLKNANVDIHCCTLVTPVPGADERQYAQQVAKNLGVKLHSSILDLANARFSFPLCTGAINPRISVLQYAVDETIGSFGDTFDVNSFFSGGGGDTVFCYLRGAVPAADAFKEKGILAGIAAIHDLSTMHQCTFWKAGRLTIKKLIAPSNSPIKADMSFLNPSMIIEARETHPWFNVPAGTLPGDKERIYNLAGTQIFRDGAPRGFKRLLRLPLLSQPVMEACLMVPTWMWILKGYNRSVARVAFADLLPHAILNRRSKGTFINYSGAVFENNKEQIRDFLLDGHLQAQQLLDSNLLDIFFRSTRPARDTTFMRILDLCTIENWIRQQ